MQPGLHFYADGDQMEMGQKPFDVAVVMPSLLRPSLFHALHSIFAQKFPAGQQKRIQIMIGVDCLNNDHANELLARACAERPSNCVVSVLWPGYSTSQRHGGFGRARDGGVLRSVLSQLANAPRIAYLDDDNWWAPEHLASMLEAIEGHDWAWSGRHFVHPKTLRPICEDLWESVGPGGGYSASGSVGL
ncbi:glycosyltransferase family 2 protein [Neokomagataea tanensis]|uniref:glycosyltransferase family 2 protein n=1 Tax=Neokomagataea tanensis TaxID=661191 RepID=UPI001F0D7389|nr:glycosyltransferase family 2 protein [Neokomagataea tanensis]